VRGRLLTSMIQNARKCHHQIVLAIRFCLAFHAYNSIYMPLKLFPAVCRLLAGRHFSDMCWLALDQWSPPPLTPAPAAIFTPFNSCWWACWPFAAVEELYGPKPRSPRVVQAYPRGEGLYQSSMIANGCWEQMEALKAGEEDRMYVMHFRVTKHAFEGLHMFIRPHIIRSSDLPMNDGRVVPTRMRLAITLYWLAEGCSYRALADVWQVGHTTVKAIVRETVQVLEKHLVPVMIVFPTSVADIHSVMSGFVSRVSGIYMPGCIGAVDGTYVPILRPNYKHFPEEYWCYKHNNYAILLVAVVDACERFTFISTGHPATAADSTVFTDSTLFQLWQEGKILNSFSMRYPVDGHMVHPYVIADGAFALSPQVIKRHTSFSPDSDKSEQAVFDRAHSNARRKVECAFGKLKARWRILDNAQRHKSVAFATSVTRVCCALHNMCQQPNAETLDVRTDMPIPEFLDTSYNPCKPLTDRGSGLELQALLTYTHSTPHNCLPFLRHARHTRTDKHHKIPHLIPLVEPSGNLLIPVGLALVFGVESDGLLLHVVRPCLITPLCCFLPLWNTNDIGVTARVFGISAFTARHHFNAYKVRYTRYSK